eukprot:c4748_g2_i1.p1 GENE.c4748_g2_i1~~c4748_g2_i1.p1  ORF type:complete len:1121 (+),score=367.41 c4748_g2_i1:106-3363(+)
MADLPTLLQQLMSSDNNIRSEGERILEALKQNPEQLVSGLLNIAAAEQAPDDIRLMATLLIRKVLVRDEETVWEKLSPEQKMATKQTLLSLLLAELPKNRRRKICDTIAEIISTKEGESVVQLLPQLLEWSVGQNLALRLSGLLIISQLCKEVDEPEEFAPFVNGLLNIVQQNMQLTTPEHLNLRVAALDVYGSISSIGDKATIENWQSLLPLAIQLIGDVLNLGLEPEARTALQILISIGEADSKGRLLKPHLNQITQAMLTVASHAQIDDDLRNLALEFLLTVVTNNPPACRKLPTFAETMFSIVISRMLEVDDDIADWNNDDPEEEDTDPENYSVGMEALDRLAVALRWNALRNACQALMQQFLNSADWKHRHAAIMSISQIGEVIPQEELDPIIRILLQFMVDSHPRVRWAAINGIGQLSTDFGPYLQDNFHAEIVPRLVACISDNTSPRVQAHAASAVINFVEHLKEELMGPYLDTLLVALQNLLQSPNPHVMMHALPAIASIADVAEGNFTKYYDSFMPYLKAILTAAHTQGNAKLLSKAVECITLIGVAVGKEKFINDAKDVIPVMLHTQQHSTTEAGQPLHSYMLSAWTRMCKVMGPDFIPYLDTVMPSLLDTVKLDDVINVEGDSDDDEPEQVFVNTGLMDDKSTAVNMLYVYASELKGGFSVWVQRVFEALVPCLTFVYMAEVRATAAACMPELLRCVDDRLTIDGVTDKSAVSQLFFVIFEELTKAIQHEMALAKLAEHGPEHEDALASLIEALQTSVSVAKANVMTQEHIRRTCALIQALVTYFDEKQTVRESSKTTDDYDNVVETQNDEDYEKDDECLLELSVLFGAMIKSCDPSVVMQAFEELLRDLFLPRLAPNQTSNNRKIALYMFDDVIEFGRAGQQPYFPTVAQAIIQSCADTDPQIRQAATFGVGSCADKATQAFSPFLENGCRALVHCISQSDAHNDDNGPATDNAISALGKIMMAYPQTVSNLTPHFLNHMPLAHDLEEGFAAYSNLLALLSRDSAAVFGTSFENIPKLVQIFGKILNPSHGMLKSEQLPVFKSFFSQLAAHNPPGFQNAVAALDEESKHFLMN